MGYVILLWHSLSLPYNYFAEALKVISFQNDVYILHGRSPSKGTIISKIHTFFYNIKRSVETLSVYILLV